MSFSVRGGAHRTEASGIRNGKKVVISGSAVLGIAWDVESQKRVIVRETTMNRVDEV
jgi:hypothetical protein